MIERTQDDGEWPTDFGGLLRMYRREAGMSLGDLARALGVSTTYVSNVERGKRGPLAGPQVMRAVAAMRLERWQAECLAGAAARYRGVHMLPVTESFVAEIVGARLATHWGELSDATLCAIGEVLDVHRDAWQCGTTPGHKDSQGAG